MADEERQERERRLMETIPGGWDRRPVMIAHEIALFLDSIKDQGTGIDSGTDGFSGDLWVTVQGVEYYIEIRKSNKQLKKEGLPVPRAD